MANKERPVVKHFHGVGEPPEGALSAYEIGIGLDTSNASEYKAKLYTSADGQQILPIGEVDEKLSDTSVNSVQNKIITQALTAKEDYLPMETIRTVIVGDETTYKDSDIFSYDDDGNLVRMVISTGDNDLPFHLKEVYCNLTLPVNSAVTATSYNFVCNPFSCVALDDNGFPKNYNGYKINNTSEAFVPTTKYYQRIYSSIGDDGLALGFSTGKTTGSDSAATWRHWIGSSILSFTNMWGKVTKVVRINAIVAYAGSNLYPIPDGTTILIRGRRMNED